MRIIGLCGRKASGKNFVADRIELIVNSQGEAVKIEKAAFADPLKEYAITVLGIRRECAYGSDDQKNTKTIYLWENMPAFVRERNRGKSGQMSVREVLQIFGTELGRLCWGNDIWVRAMQRRIAQSDVGYFLITDVRFPNEADVIREMGGEVWLINGPRVASGDGHASEDVGSVAVDKVIENDYLSRRPTRAEDALRDDLSDQIRAAMELVEA